MVFTQNWFEVMAKDNFERFKNYIGTNKPLNFLEIGCFEGNAHLYMYENILIHPESKSTVIEPWGGGTGNSTHHDVSDIFRNNLKNYLEKITICRGLSNDFLPKLAEQFDIIYIDGDHTSKQTYIDGILSWDLLKKDGIMIFDDYKWHGYRLLDKNIPESMAIGEINHPALGINKFLEEKKGQYELFGSNQGFEKECKIINLEKINDIKYIQELNNYNYQIWIQKTSNDSYYKS